MIRLEDRHQIAQGIQAAHQAGARPCQIAGIDVRTLQRWKASDGLQAGDGCPTATRPVPAHALSAQEREQVLQVANQGRFADMRPARIVPMLADEGTYLASESTFCRLLRAQGQNTHRGALNRPGNPGGSLV